MWFPLSFRSDSDYAFSAASVPGCGCRLSVGTRVDDGCVYIVVYYFARTRDDITNQIGENVTDASQPRKTILSPLTPISTLRCRMPRKPRSLRNLALSPKRSSPTRSPSPTFSDATRASAINFGADGPEKIITRTNLKMSLQAYDEVRQCNFGCRNVLDCPNAL